MIQSNIRATHMEKTLYCVVVVEGQILLLPNADDPSTLQPTGLQESS